MKLMKIDLDKLPDKPAYAVIESKLLGEKVIILSDKRQRKKLQAENPDIAIYGDDEVSNMLEYSKEDVRRIHVVKKIFNGRVM
jgi:hypothetical protein